VVFSNTASFFLDVCTHIPACHALGTEENVRLLNAMVGAIDEITAYTCDASKFRTLVHGDVKTSNIFFPAAFDSSSRASPDPSGPPLCTYFACISV
jgi:hypothetical protein